MSLLIDSSSWIAFMRSGAEKTPEVAVALRDGNAAMTEPVWAELWGGAKGKREEEFLRSLREACVWLPVDGATWEKSYELRRKALRSGLNCPLADVLMVACARQHDAYLLHRDKHLEALLEL